MRFYWMRKKTPSDGILVFDRYYGRKPSAALLLITRMLFCAAFSAASALFVFSQYGLSQISLGVTGVVASISAALLLLLFVAVKRRFAVPAIAAILGIIAFFTRSELFTKLSFFVHEIVRLADGRFVNSDKLLKNSMNYSVFSYYYAEGVILGSVLLCVMIGMLCALTMTRRIHVIPSVVVAVVLCVPCFLAENFEFNALCLPFILLAAGGIAVSLNYSDGLAVVRSGGSVYHAQLKEDESAFLKKTDKAGLFKRISMRICYYSKYATSGFYAVTAFSLALIVGINCFSEGSSINYKAFFEWLDNFGSNDAEVTINDDKVSDFFTGEDDKQEGLSITSPGRGRADVIRVKYTGDYPIYLRGDIGIEFTGTSWLTPLNDSSYWESCVFSEYYRPAEIRILSMLLNELNGKPVAAESNISIEYLKETDIVFLPAYTGDYSYYNNDNFKVFGDYCVRVSSEAGNHINSVQCTAVIGDLVALGYEEGAAIVASATECLENYDISINELYSSVVPNTDSSIDVLAEYSDYVETAYLSVPEDISTQLTSFMYDSGLWDEIWKYSEMDVSDSEFRYRTASLIDKYLNENYTYSLSNANRGNGAVMRFLTESKSGHCSLYASAMTLMLREAGVPARYCTGFAIHPDKESSDTVTLKEKNLHAWVEVYLEEFGWVTFDPTSAAVNAPATDETLENRPQVTRPSSTTTTANETAPSVENTDESSADETEDNSTEENTGASAEPFNPVPIIVICISVAAIFAVVAAIYFYQQQRKRAELYIGRAANRSSTEICGCILDVLSYYGFSPAQGELPTAFYSRVDGELNVGLYSNAALLEAAEFSHSDGNSDNKELAALLSRLYCVLMKKNGIVRRYNIRKIVLNCLSKRQK